ERTRRNLVRSVAAARLNVKGVALNAAIARPIAVSMRAWRGSMSSTTAMKSSMLAIAAGLGARIVLNWRVALASEARAAMRSAGGIALVIRVRALTNP